MKGSTSDAGHWEPGLQSRCLKPIPEICGKRIVRVMVRKGSTASSDSSESQISLTEN